MTTTDWLIIGGIYLALSLLAFMIILGVLAQSAKDALDQAADAECCAEWGNETAVHTEAL